MSTLVIERNLPSGGVLQIVQGDITTEDVDAIVNAANSQLQHGGGLARAISERGGPAIQRESDEWVRTKGAVTHAHPAWTSGGNLPAKYVIHAVGPVWGAGDEETKLAAAVRGALRVADELDLASVALPAISTGIFGYPLDGAARTILASIQAYFQQTQDTSVRLVRLVLFDESSTQAFLDAGEV